ncbi:MAG: hypothetical protein ABIB47_05230 [Candidatus Woesearchaeota archaeon]
MYNSIFREWLREHDGEIVHPLEVVGSLESSGCSRSLSRYLLFEAKRLLIPMGYRHGQITAVKIQFSTRLSLEEIERDNQLDYGTLKQKLSELSEQPREQPLKEVDSLGLSQKVTDTLVAEGYIRIFGGRRVCLRRRGHNLFGAGH